MRGSSAVATESSQGHCVTTLSLQLCKNRTDFVLDAARRAAEETLLDRTVLAVSSKAYREFLKRLDAPPKPNKRLLKTMLTPAPWD